MGDWKKRLYGSYVSSGQAGAGVSDWNAFDAARFPFYSNLIRNHVPADRDLEIVDLACGYGSLVYCLRESGYRNVQGVDFSREQVDLAHRLGLDDIECSGLQDFLDRSTKLFDVVFLMDILEHLTREELFSILDGVHRRLKPGGKLIISAPNGAGLFGMRIRYGDLTHENCFTPSSMTQVLKTTGFNDVRVMELSPVRHNLKGSIRSVLWSLLTLPHRLLLAVETGETHHILTQNLLVTAGRPADTPK